MHNRNNLTIQRFTRNTIYLYKVSENCLIQKQVSYLIRQTLLIKTVTR